jgi:hypothetical protein
MRPDPRVRGPVPSSSRTFTAKEVQLDAVPGRGPDKLEAPERGGRGDLAQAEELAIEGPEGILVAVAERR